MHHPADTPRHAVISRALAPFGTSIFSQMTQLSIQHGAINLAQGFPDFDGPASIKDAAIDAIRAGHGQYARMAGLPALCQAIAQSWLGDSGFAVDPDTQVTVTAGCTEAIAATMLGLLNPGDEVVLFEPFYDSYRACVAMAGATARFVTLEAPDFTFSDEDLDAAFTPRTRLVLVNTPHNPTGRVFSRGELQRIADRCVRHGAILVSDEVYERLVYDPVRTPLVRPATLPGMAERTITLSSLGKTFSLTGWKIGWAIAPPALSAAIRAAHQFLTFAVSTPMQHAAAVALASPASYYAELVADYRRKRDLLSSALARLRFEVVVPEGSYFVFAGLGRAARKLGANDDVSFCRTLIERCGVAAIPPSAFYAQSDEGRRYVRFAFCKKDETLHAAIERLERGLGG